MRTRFVTTLVAASLATASCAHHSSEAVVWRGRTFQEVRVLSDLPAGIRSELGASRSGVEGIAERNRPFNLTDVVYADLPIRRFLAAGKSGDTRLVALERGGRGYSVEVFLFSASEVHPQQKWVLLDRPTSLAEVVQGVSQQEN
jgi:hypothetical protein